MSVSRFEKVLPWGGAVAGVCWVAHDLLHRQDVTDQPGQASSEIIRSHLALNYGSVGSLVLMGIALLFFATSVRNVLRSGEPREATYSSIAFAGWIVAVAGIGQMVMWNWGLINGAADARDDAALHTLSYVAYFGWAGMGVGIATAFIATGLGGIRTTALPTWFGITTVVLGVLSALGNAGIPPGGLVTYLLLPLWLVVASVIVSRRQRAAEIGATQGDVQSAVPV